MIIPAASACERAGGGVRPFFLETQSGVRFCLFHPAAHASEAPRALIYVHPFGEEMNKARRMAALQARRLAAAGCAVLQIDLHGCGDSSGEFVQARWETWKDDVSRAVRWLRDHEGGDVGLWGMRLGSSLAVDVARDGSLGIDELLLWQPVVAGDAFLTQFLRLHLAAQMLSEGTASTGMEKLRETLASGTPLEIAGYELHPELAAAIERCRLAGALPKVNRVHWLEVSAMPEPKITPASARVVQSWRAGGLDVRAHALCGEPFWSSLEIVDCPALLEATDAMVSARPTCPS
jgi:exosortase A-associated hydrolase 2